MKRIAAAAVALIIGGCATTSAPPPEPDMGFSRFDCKSIAADAKLQAQLEQDKAVCINRAEAAAIAGTTSIPIGNGVVNAAFSGMQRGAAQRDIAVATVKSCMAERGYYFVTRTEHAERCSAPRR